MIKKKWMLILVVIVFFSLSAIFYYAISSIKNINLTIASNSDTLSENNDSVMYLREPEIYVSVSPKFEFLPNNESYFYNITFDIFATRLHGDISIQESKKIDLNDIFLNTDEVNALVTILNVDGKKVAESGLTLILDQEKPLLESITSDVNSSLIISDNEFIVSLDNDSLNIVLNISEESTLKTRCEEDLDICSVNENDIKSKELLLDIDDRNYDENPVILFVELEDKAGNISEFSIKIVNDGSGPIITRKSKSPYRVDTFYKCENTYKLQISLDEEAKYVKKDSMVMKYNPKSNLYELSFAMKEGIHSYKIVAEDLYGNVSEKIVKVDGICRTDTYLGLVHPYCFQRALIACQPQQQGPCIENYVNTKCDDYH